MGICDNNYHKFDFLIFKGKFFRKIFFRMYFNHLNHIIAFFFIISYLDNLIYIIIIDSISFEIVDGRYFNPYNRIILLIKCIIIWKICNICHHLFITLKKTKHNPVNFLFIHFILLKIIII